MSEDRTLRRTRINTMMDVASAVRDLVVRNQLPIGMQEMLLHVEDEAWRILRNDLGAHFEDKR